MKAKSVSISTPLSSPRSGSIGHSGFRHRKHVIPSEYPMSKSIPSETIPAILRDGSLRRITLACLRSPVDLHAPFHSSQQGAHMIAEVDSEGELLFESATLLTDSMAPTLMWIS